MADLEKRTDSQTTMLKALIVLTVAAEDRMLHAELPGYDKYATRVRFRLVPGVW